MKCQHCEADFPENLIQLSHDVPVYMFKGITRKERKNQADKFGRHYLCQVCHEVYEDMLRVEVKETALTFAKRFFR